MNSTMDPPLPRLTTLSSLPKRPAVNIEFNELSYKLPFAGKDSMPILKKISGSIKSGSLTAILGPSGAGKSTLLNVLAGYKVEGANGLVTVNGVPRDLDLFRKFSCYILQEDELQQYLTLKECISFAADLKLGSSTTKEQKHTVVDEIIQALRLEHCGNTRTDKLSGGEKKRLLIAMELVNNPPIIFLDEPTTGLDDLSSSCCISVLKMLAKGGRTIVCSIHTPSAKLFEMFDRVYVIADGQCVYQGSPGNIVPYLHSIGPVCPSHYNPADYVIEVASREYGDWIPQMVEAIDNGHQIYSADAEYPETPVAEYITPLRLEHLYTHSVHSFWSQLLVLLRRMQVQLFRNYDYFVSQIIIHLGIGALIGTTFYNIGDDGARSLYSFGLCLMCMAFFIYIPLIPTLVLFPYEVKLLHKEHFNQWYGLSSYYFALTLSRIPFQTLFGIVFVAMVYFLTGQPIEALRFFQFLAICLLVSLVAETTGLVVSSQLSGVNSLFTGTVGSCPLLIISIYGVGSRFESIPILLKILMYLSYLRYGVEGVSIAMFGNGRKRLSCPQDVIYCHFREPSVLLTELGLDNAVFWVDVVGLVVILILTRILFYFSLKWRMSTREPLAAFYFIGRIIQKTGIKTL